MNGCNSVCVIDGESVGIVCHGNHAPGERHVGGLGGLVWWTDAEAAGTMTPADSPHVFVMPPSAPKPGSGSNR